MNTQPLLDQPRQESNLAELYPKRGIRMILVPLDLDDRGRALLQAASAWSEQLEAKLVFLHVCQLMTFVPPLATASQFNDWNAGVKKAAERKFCEMRAEFEEDPFVQKADFLVVQGILEQEIVAVAKAIQADMILLTTHAYRGLRHFLIGSKAEAVLHEAPCPVLILPLHERQPGQIFKRAPAGDMPHQDRTK